MTQRCGSYPYRYIAEDFGLPYAVVLQYSDGVANGMGAGMICGREDREHSKSVVGYWGWLASAYVQSRLTCSELLRFHDAIARQVNND